MTTIARTIKRDLGSQVCISRNLGESRSVKCRRAFWAVALLVKAIKIGCLSMREEQLGSRVIFNWREGFINNWAGSETPWLAGACGYHQQVPRSEITSVVNASELWHRFKFGFSFYMGNWHGIDVNRRVYPEHYRD